MSDRRPAVYGADMVPEPIPDWARVEPAAPVPQTHTERDESVNADVLRRDLHIRMDALVRYVRSLPIENPIYVPDIVRGAYIDIEGAISRYLQVERTFRKSR